jgi:RNA polymerase sigma-70 factor, ECF subfamily
MEQVRQVRDVEGERLRIEAAQRDPSRFGELYEEHFDRVYAYVARRVRDRSEAQDLTSEVFQQALANLSRFEWRGAPFAAWLYRIAANAVTDHYHRTRRESDAPVTTEEPAPDEIEVIEQRAALFRSVEALPADQRRVIVMRFAEEKSIREVSAEIGRSEGAVKQLQWRALQTLRNRMGTGLGQGRGEGRGQSHG